MYAYLGLAWLREGAYRRHRLTLPPPHRLKSSTASLQKSCINPMISIYRPSLLVYPATYSIYSPFIPVFSLCSLAPAFSPPAAATLLLLLSAHICPSSVSS